MKRNFKRSWISKWHDFSKLVTFTSNPFNDGTLRNNVTRYVIWLGPNLYCGIVIHILLLYDLSCKKQTMFKVLPIFVFRDFWLTKGWKIMPLAWGTHWVITTASILRESSSSLLCPILYMPANQIKWKYFNCNVLIMIIILTAENVELQRIMV